MVEDRSRRNVNYVVRVGSSGGLFLKQAPPGSSDLRSEASICQMLASCLPGGAVPDVLLEDPRQRLVVFGLVPGESLLDVPLSASPDSVHLAPAMEALGDLLARLHQQPASPRRDASVATGAPGVLSLDCPDVELTELLSPAGLQLVSALQDLPWATELLRRLRTGWASRSLIHGDLRPENVLVSRTRGQGEVCLVDWELAGAGDRSWDLGMVFAGHVSRWIESSGPAAPHDSKTPPAPRWTLERLSPLIRAFWHSYRAVSRLSADVSRSLLDSAVRFAGSALIQSALERCEGRTRLSTDAVLHLQAGLNLLRGPGQGARLLLASGASG